MPSESYDKNKRPTHTKEEANKKEALLSKCWLYLNDNFTKFSQTNKIKISLELCKKDIPQEVKGDLFGSAEITKAIAKLSPGDLECLIADCRTRASKESSV